jgi:hypothetical protein
MAALMVAGAARWVVVARETNKERSMTSQHEEAGASAITVGDLVKASRTRVAAVLLKAVAQASPR